MLILLIVICVLMLIRIRQDKPAVPQRFRTMANQARKRFTMHSARTEDNELYTTNEQPPPAYPGQVSRLNVVVEFNGNSPLTLTLSRLFWQLFLRFSITTISSFEITGFCIINFYCHAMLYISAAYAVARCPSVSPSRLCILKSSQVK